VPLPALWNDPGAGKPRSFLEADNKIGTFPDLPSFDEFIKDYNATITAVDDNVGKVLAAVDELKIADDTAILFTADNGFFLGEWQRFDKRLMHEPSIRVPLLVRYPKLTKPGSSTKKMTINPDYAPTVLELAGVKKPEYMHGRSLAPLLAGRETADWRKDWLYRYYEYPDSHACPPCLGVRTETHKLIRYLTKPEEFELYDLVADPEERVNLADKPEHAALKQRLLTRIDELRKEVGDAGELEFVTLLDPKTRPREMPAMPKKKAPKKG
ncbi:MAG TPA: sulfatase/phosphatase domain-containing protein, partial [Planctomycetia bacterium]|nr:sulfatase/phosphatase domain-containing protein [Planctomycetia bacterium]